MKPQYPILTVLVILATSSHAFAEGDWKTRFCGNSASEKICSETSDQNRQSRMVVSALEGASPIYYKIDGQSVSTMGGGLYFSAQNDSAELVTVIVHSDCQTGTYRSGYGEEKFTFTEIRTVTQGTIEKKTGCKFPDAKTLN